MTRRRRRKRRYEGGDRGRARGGAGPPDGKVRQERARVKFQDVGVDREPTAEAAAPRPAREMRVDRTDPEEHGYDGSCRQCKHLLKYGKAQRGQTHSGHCRTRIIEAMSKTESGQRRIEANEERITRTMAEQVEHSDRQAGAPAVAGGDGNDLAPAHRGFLERPREPDNIPGPSQPHPRDAGVQDAYRDRAREYNGPTRTEKAAERPTSEPSGGVSGALGAPTDEAFPAETPVEEDPEGQMKHEDAPQDVEMDFVGCVSASQGIGSFEPSFDDEVSG